MKQFGSSTEKQSDIPFLVPFYQDKRVQRERGESFEGEGSRERFCGLLVLFFFFLDGKEEEKKK